MPDHHRTEELRWTIVVAEHPPRTESSGYRASRTLMGKIIATVPEWMMGEGPYQDHHGGSIWVKDAEGWLCLLQPLGIEWSAQFCADPAKIDRIRLSARRAVAAFPLTIPGYEELGYTRGRSLLDTEITTADQVADWTDSIFNASMPLHAHSHSGVLPTGAGYHHYPKPIVDIDHFRRDDFMLFVTDEEGLPAVVVPVTADPEDKRVRLLAANAASVYAARLIPDGARSPSPGHHDRGTRGAAASEDAVLPAGDPLSRQAFGEPRP
ncbi:hypothetical protein NOCA2430006 [metagenome]|uniref:Uncharacterized protein n=1 Tax=metagenome TaxID=256318 RepID=A0A2P2C6I9_9ZZZZ